MAKVEDFFKDLVAKDAMQLDNIFIKGPD